MISMIISVDIAQDTYSYRTTTSLGTTTTAKLEPTREIDESGSLTEERFEEATATLSSESEQVAHTSHVYG